MEIYNDVVRKLETSGVPFVVVKYRVHCPFFPEDNATEYEIIAKHDTRLYKYGLWDIYDPYRYRGLYMHLVLSLSQAERFRRRRLPPSFHNAWGEAWEFNGGIPKRRGPTKRETQYLRARPACIPE